MVEAAQLLTPTLISALSGRAGAPSKFPLSAQDRKK
jgi:hypothetical protein